MVFITVKLIVFLKKISEFFKFSVFVLYCLIVTKPLWTGPISFLVNYKLFFLVSVLSDAILTSLLSFVF